MIIKEAKQGSELWLEDKLGVLSGTKLKKIVTAKKMELAAPHVATIYELIDESITGIQSDDVFVSKAMARGNALEPLARVEYIKKTGNEIIETGLCLSDSNENHGCSPDGWTMGYIGGIEIKCPGGANHLKYIMDNILPSEHKLQFVNYFLVNEKLEWLDFVSYRPEFYPNPIFIKRITRVELEEEISIISGVLELFFQKYNETLELLTF